jgi:hypothetical protein
LQFRPASQPTGRTLISRYVFTGNKEIYPTAMDLTTGIITVGSSLTAQGFTVGSYYNMMFVIHAFATKILPKEINPTTDYYTYILSDTTIQLSTANNSSGLISSYPDASNTGVDPTKWHIEYASTTINISFDTSSLNLSDVLFHFDFPGRDRGGYPYVNLHGTSDEGTINLTGLTIIDGRETMTVTGAVRYRYSKESKTFFNWLDHAHSIQWGNNTNGSWSYSTVTASSQASTWRSYTNAKITSLSMSGITVANGSVFELYDMKGGY